MHFISLHFLAFFTLVVVAHYQIPHRYRQALLLAASVYFYSLFVPYYLLVLASIVLFNYALGPQLEKTTGANKKQVFWFALSVNLSILFVFKYFNFASENLHALSNQLGMHYPLLRLDLLLPIGLSFHTFQTLSYLIEIYRGRQRAEKNLTHFALYIFFFPQLVAGPIERPQNLLPQLSKKRDFSWDQAKAGLKLMAMGFFKKMVVADRLAQFVDPVYHSPTTYSGNALLIASYFFTVQVYCDFSGYTDIARGSAKVLGINLMENFRSPLFARSVPDYWKRWHISLSTWFRDYLYFPLGGNRVSLPRWVFNIGLVFLASGLWHGASWNFVVWGLLQAIFYLAAVQLAPLWESSLSLFPEKFRKFIAIFFTFQLLNIAKIFFRAPTIASAGEVLSGILGRGPVSPSLFLPLGYTAFDFALGVLLFAGVLYAQYRNDNHQKNYWEVVDEQKTWRRWLGYYLFALTFLVLAWVIGRPAPQQFIYFQF